ncbi:hypothetical protein OSB04_016707 [Centaurea solstitialis]|uniref:Uncharacterized protein n=1 Tax=Centaurea solstitialis TaxID=347529 RepID=A0AA38WA19_9ASTR|nr:hypothetical protein OSB04_016707 [Centaurea solstitialis]
MATSGSNFESIRVINSVASILENGTISKPPRFNPSDFSLWKSRMMLFMEGIDSRYLTILRDGPLIPRVWDRFKKEKDGSSSVEDRSSAYGRYILKSEKKYTDEDWKLVSLDTKVRAIIVMSLPDEVYHSLVNFSTAKEMWSTLCVLYEDSNEVKKKVYDNEEMLNKFMDGLPEFWENICTCIKTSKDLETMPLSVLFGTLVNYEQTKLQRKSLFNDIKSSSIAFMSKNSKSMCTPQIFYPSSDSENADSKNSFYPSEEYLSDADDEGGESSIDQDTNGLQPSEGSNKSSSGRFERSSSGRYNRFVSSFSNTNHVGMYNAKYLREKELADETTSESEKDTANTCLMAKDEPSSNSSSKVIVSTERSSISQNILSHKIWYLDSGFSSHMIGDKSILSNYVCENGPYVTFGGNTRGTTQGYGYLSRKLPMWKG